MGSGEIGGNGSVQWQISGDDVGNNHNSQPNGAFGRRQSGIDQTPPGQQYFEILLDDSAVLDPPAPAGYIKYKLEILPNKPKQIQVKWRSRTGAPMELNPYIATLKSGAKT
jgi:hypothetical protein